MVSDRSGDTTVELSIPQALDEWLSARADEWEVDRETVVRRLLTAYHVATTHDREEGELHLDDADETLLDLISGGSDRIDTRFEELERRYTDDLDDVRKRVVQLKRELDEKAPEDHGHPSIVEQLRAVREAIEGIEERLEGLEDGQQNLTDRIDGGFENYRDILEHLIDETDELETRIEKVAAVIVRYRDDLNAVSAMLDDHEVLSTITAEAIEQGIRTARCDHCGTSVDIGLLTEPICPECSSRFETVVPKQGFFGNSRLKTQDPPALETSEEIDGFQFGRTTTIEDVERQRRSSAPDGGEGETP